jgi:hypothetical protein
MAVGPAGGAAETLAAIQQTTANQVQQSAENIVEQEVSESGPSVASQSSGSSLNTIDTTA